MYAVNMVGLFSKKRVKIRFFQAACSGARRGIVIISHALRVSLTHAISNYIPTLEELKTKRHSISMVNNGEVS